MAFNISQFNQQISNAGGVNGSNKFIVRITPPAVLDPSRNTGTRTDSAQTRLGVTAADDSDLLQFLCDSVNLPGKSLEVIDYKPQGFGKTSKMPHGINFDNLSLTFMLDSNHRVLYFYELWLQEIINTSSTVSGERATYNNRTAFEMNYKKNYTATVEIIYFSDSDATGKTAITYKFIDAFPIQTGSVQLAWEANDQIAKLPVEFTYSSYTVFENQLDFPVSDTRGENPLYEIGNVLGGGEGIQRAINRITNIENSVSSFFDRIF